eukprot:890296-Prymnesium_polylepis.1
MASTTTGVYLERNALAAAALVSRGITEARVPGLAPAKSSVTEMITLAPRTDTWMREAGSPVLSAKA